MLKMNGGLYVINPPHPFKVDTISFPPLNLRGVDWATEKVLITRNITTDGN